MWLLKKQTKSVLQPYYFIPDVIANTEIRGKSQGRARAHTHTHILLMYYCLTFFLCTALTHYACYICSQFLNWWNVSFVFKYTYEGHRTQCTSWWSVWHSCFVFGTSRVLIEARNTLQYVFLFTPLSFRTEHRASTVPHHLRLLFQFLGSIGHLVGLLGGEISPAQGLYLHRTTQHRKTQTNIHAPSKIRTCDPNIRAAEDSTCLRPRGHWDRQWK
jgi:hypothetical protein